MRAARSLDYARLKVQTPAPGFKGSPLRVKPREPGRDWLPGSPLVLISGVTDEPESRSPEDRHVGRQPFPLGDEPACLRVHVHRCRGIAFDRHDTAAVLTVDGP